MIPQSGGPPIRLVVSIACAVLASELLRTAWVSDDSYITFRVADNIIHGFGPVWNTTERVQAYTHPLWLAVFTGAYALTREAYYTSLALGAALSLIAVLILRRLARSSWSLVVACAAIVSSKAFVDFSTAGLENALGHVVVLWFLWSWWRDQNGVDRALRLTAVGSLCVLNRIDLALLVGPAIAIELLRSKHPGAWRSAAIGLLPVIMWELFSVFYYASLTPNTAYAKLNISLPLNEAIARGWHYVIRTAAADPATFPVMALAVAVTLRDSARRDWPLVAGLVATLIYVVWIGGDFMMGRFFSVPLAWSAGLLSASVRLATPRPAIIAAAAVVIAGLAAPWEPALLSGYGYVPLDNWMHRRAERTPRDLGLSITKFEITDTRRYYFEGTGLLKGRLGDRRPDHPGVDDGVDLRKRGRQVVIRDHIGFTGFFAGPEVHIVDKFALTDALLARLPSVPGSRVGHYLRDIPAGYLDSLLHNRNLIADPDLAEYFSHLRFAVSGPLFDARRVLAAAQFTFGRYDAGLERYTAKMRP